VDLILRSAVLRFEYMTFAQKNPRFRPISDQETRVKQEWIAALWADSR
jgi:hypothetical protein